MGSVTNKLYIGTSGWLYKHWRDTFYPQELKAASQFDYYKERFNTVEINNSFYRLPDASTFEKWKNAVPDGFTYAVKANRYITHMKKLRDPVESCKRFFDNVVFMGDKLGSILFQLPPFLKKNPAVLDEFVRALPKGFRYVFELRNESWYDPGIFEILKAGNCAFCIYELDGHLTPMEVTANFVYVRLHGPGAKYQGSYNEATLQQWAEQCREWLTQSDVYFYFDNDEKGYAAFNAQRLIELCAG